MKRHLNPTITQDLPTKIVLLTGPRDSGKTTLARQLQSSAIYFNYDLPDDRLLIKQQSWSPDTPLVIFDELHKMREWKRWLKGIYDTRGIPPQLLVTGSARLDTYRKTGDSLAGRFFQHQLHPLDLKELADLDYQTPSENFEQLWRCGNFPEPFLSGQHSFYRRWQQSHLDIILRQDLTDLYPIHDIQGIETLVALLRQRAGACVSYANLARDVERDPNTIKRWLQLLENLYIIFRVTPYHKNVARSLLKEPKYYFYDHNQIHASNKGARLENIVACHLLKALHFLRDTRGYKGSLHFLRTKDGKELDFLIYIDEQPRYLIEVKWKDDKPAVGFQHFRKIFPGAKAIQLVKDLKHEKFYPDGLAIHDLVQWLSQIDLQGSDEL